MTGHQSCPHHESQSVGSAHSWRCCSRRARPRPAASRALATSIAGARRRRDRYIRFTGSGRVDGARRRRSRVPRVHRGRRGRFRIGSGRHRHPRLDGNHRRRDLLHLGADQRAGAPDWDAARWTDHSPDRIRSALVRDEVGIDAGTQCPADGWLAAAGGVRSSQHHGLQRRSQRDAGDCRSAER
jgi:hypothetical protein